MVCFILAMSLLNFKKSFEFLSKLTLDFQEVIEEFTCERDLALYTMVLLLTAPTIEEMQSMVK